MRWFVEVSRIGEDADSQRYCVEAKQWQAALQEARKLRGDLGPLSKFSIELMDDGYRAVDPRLKIRYVVNKAPGNAPLTGSNGAAAAPSPSKPPATTVSAPSPSKAPATTASAPSPSKAPATTHGSAPATERTSGPPVSTPAKKPSRPNIRVPDDAVPPPPPGPKAPFKSTHPTQRSMEAPKLPAFQVVRKREEEPTEKTPITYREYAYAVAEDTSIRSAEALLWARFREVRSSLEGRAPGQFVQLAVFDHVFERRPSRPPLATLAWKDWRGNPVVQFPGTPTAQPSAPPPGALPPSAPPEKPASAAPAQKPAPVIAPPQEPAPPQKPAPAAAAPPISSPAAAAAPPISAPAAAAAPISSPAAAAAPISSPAAAPVGRRHKAGEDLIGELFETMHELHFMPDLVAGAEFVLGVLEKTLPCEAVLIHVFDINTQHYVVVRAKAPGAAKVIMHRRPDRDELFEPVMRRMRSLRIDDALADGRFNAERWKRAGVEVKSAVCGPVQLHGRYLGMVELANPEGGGGFYESESNALDYICEQFAEFLVNHPIVLDAELILAKP